MRQRRKPQKMSARVRDAISALHLAALRDDVAAARRALRAGAPVDAKAVDKGLSAAAQRRVFANPKMWAFDDDVRNRYRRSAFLGPERRVVCSARSGQTALYRAVDGGSAGVAQLLIATGASLEIREEGETPLMLAARRGRLEIVRALVDAGADVNAVASSGHTAYDLAVGSEKKEVAAYLRTRGATSKVEGLRSVAKAYARRYAGAVKYLEGREAGLPPCVYVVAGTHEGRLLNFWMFDGGCVVEGDAPSGHRRPSRKSLAALNLGAGELLRTSPRGLLSVVATPTFALVHRGTDFALLDARLRVLAKLFPYRAGRRKATVAARPVTDVAYRIKIGRPPSARGDDVSWFGGRLEPGLKCRNCLTPMHLLLTFDPRALEIRRLGRRNFRIVYCLNCMSFPGLLYLDYSKPRLRVIKQDAEERANEDEALDVRTVTLARLEPATRSGSKIGGTPNWIQGPDVPECVRCRKPMSFVAQIASLPELSFVDDGTLYTFACTSCRVSASFIQSH
jgi:hypothetical protein